MTVLVHVRRERTYRIPVSYELSQCKAEHGFKFVPAPVMLEVPLILLERFDELRPGCSAGLVNSCALEKLVNVDFVLVESPLSPFQRILAISVGTSVSSVNIKL